MKNKKWLWPIGRAAKILLALSVASPVLLFVAMLLGADLWDGFAGGGYQNTQLQESILALSGRIVLPVSTLAILVLGVVANIKYLREDRRYLLLFLCIPTTFVLVFTLFFLSASLST